MSRRPALRATLAAIAIIAMTMVGTILPPAAVAGSGPRTAPVMGTTVGAAPAASEASLATAGVRGSRLIAEGEYGCAINPDGTVRCWGNGSGGQLGGGQTETPSLVPITVRGIDAAVGLAGGSDHACALLATGTVRCWGSNNYGQLGWDGGRSAVSVAVAGLTGVIGITAGRGSTCALLSNGSVKCWGQNEAGQLGNGVPVPGPLTWTPVSVVGVSSAVQVDAGEHHACARLANGTVKCWGWNVFGQLGAPTPNGSEFTSTPVTVAGLTGVVAVSAGHYHTCAVLVSGAARCWGGNHSGELGNGVTLPGAAKQTPVPVLHVSGAVGIVAGYRATCAWLAKGTVWCWGENDDRQLQRSGPDSSTPAVIPGMEAVVGVSIGWYHVCAVLNGGRIRCWGGNVFGQLGNATTKTPEFPVDVVNTLGRPTIAGGGSHTCALLADGTVRCWGENGKGQLGNGKTVDSGTQVAVSGLSQVAALSVGTDHNCALVVGGTLKCWGANNRGQLGIGTLDTDDYRSTPVSVPNLPTVVAVSAGGDHTCAVLADQTARCWGGNAEGQVGDGTTGNTRPAPRTVVVFDGESHVPMSGLIDVSAGALHTCAVHQDGTAWCWGANGSGQLGIGFATGSLFSARKAVGSSDVVSISARYASTCALRANATIECWGWNAYGQAGPSSGDRHTPTPVPGDLTISIGPSSGHSAHNCSLVADGRVRCWGANANGQIGNGITSTEPNGTPQSVIPISGAVAVTAGYAHSCALLLNGTAKCWGIGTALQLGNGLAPEAQTTPVTVTGLNVGLRVAAAEAGTSHSCAIVSNTTARCWGSNGSGRLGDGTTTTRTRPVTVFGLTGATAVTAGGGQSCALLSNSTVRCWGSNTSGQLGDSTLTPRSKPVVVSGLSGVSAISAGTNHTCALIANGTVKCWGSNLSGQLGDGTLTRRLTPKTVPGLTGVVAISAGNAHTCALLSSGGAKCWGSNTRGQLGDGTTTRRLMPVTVKGLASAKQISAGTEHGCALISTGSVKCWGSNGSGRIGDGTTSTRLAPVSVAGLSGATATSAGGAHTCALVSSGSVRCWGSNAYGQLGNGNQTSSKLPVPVGSLAGGGSGISAGGNHTVVPGGRGTAWSWGLNSTGQLGIGSTTNRNVPSRLAGY